MNKRYWLRGAVAGLVIGIVVLLVVDGMEECITFSNQLSCVWLWSNVTAYREDSLHLVTNVLPLFILGPLLVGGLIGWVYGKIKK